jgi:hypothetical protein
MEQHWMNLLLFIVIILAAYLIFRYIKFGKVKEGLTSSTSSTGTGIAGNASSYNTQLQSQITQLTDTLNISGYRQDYENIILSFDDYLNLYTLQQLVSTPTSTPQEAATVLYLSGLARSGLNNLLKFIDNNK